jgi:hypothetical protein
MRADAWLRGEGQATAFSRRDLPEVCESIALEREGAGNAGCHDRTRSLAYEGRKYASSHHKARRTVRHSPHDGLWLIRAPPGVPGFVATVVSGIITQDLIPASGSGPHGFAMRTCLARPAKPARPSHPASYVRDDRDTPLLWRRDGDTTNTICVSDKANYFLCDALTGFAEFGPTGKSVQVTS